MVEEDSGQQKSGRLERRQSIRAVIASYEAQEEQFLRELDQMRAECSGNDGTATSSNDDEGNWEGAPKAENGAEGAGTEGPAMLGTLCTLIGEIGKLRRENRRLRRRLVVRPPDADVVAGSEKTPLGKLGSLPRRFAGTTALSACLPLQSSGCSSALSSFFSGASMHARAGTQAERLCSPPPAPARALKTKAGVGSGAMLTVSAYSADLSSDSSLLYPRRKRQADTQQAAPADAWEEGVPEGNEPSEAEAQDCWKPRRGMARRAELQKSPKASEEGKQLLRLSCSVTSGTSPAGSSSSASSSVEPARVQPIDPAMTASRSSFLELFGIRRLRQRPGSSNSSEGGASGPWGAFAHAVDSLVTKRMQKAGARKMSGSGKHRRHSQLLYSQQQADASASAQRMWSPPYSPAASPYALDGYSSGEMGATNGVKKLRAGVVESEPNLQNWRASKDNVQASAASCKQQRPQSCFLDPANCEDALARRQRTKSCKSVAPPPAGGRDTPQLGQSRNKQDRASVEHELRLEMQLLRARNARLIEQLRDKSGQLSMAESRIDRLARELDQLRAQKRFDDAMDCVSVRARLATSIERAFNALKDQLSDALRAQLQTLKLDAQRQQQMALNTSRRDRQVLQASMAEVERLQRENYALLQARLQQQQDGSVTAANMADLLPSYDALYAFAVGLVRKLGQMRTVLAEKCAETFQLEMDALQAHTQVLLAQAQCERWRAQLLVMDALGAEGGGTVTQKRRGSGRAVSYHGEQLSDKMANLTHLFLPLKLHAQRIRQHRKSERQDGAVDVADDNFDAVVEANEQSIELEFLRLFNSARSLNRICRGGGGGDQNENDIDAEWAQLEQIVPKLSMENGTHVAARHLQRRTQSGGMPRVAEVALRRSPTHQQNARNNSNSPRTKFRRLSAIFGGWSGRMDASGGGGGASSPPPPASSGTPVLTRRTPLPNSPRAQPQQHRRQRPVLTRQHSIHSSSHPFHYNLCHSSKGLPPSYALHTSTPFVALDESSNFGFQFRPFPLYEAPPPAQKMVDPRRGQLPPYQQQQQQQQHRPSPSAPPLALLNPNTLSRLPQPNPAGGFGPPPTSSTRRPLTRASASQSPSLGEAKRMVKSREMAKLARDTSETRSTNSRSSSMSRLPKAVSNRTAPMGPRVMAEKQKKEDEERGEGGGPERQSNAAGAQQAVSGDELKALPKAAKKAGISWLSRLRKANAQQNQ